MEDEIRELLSRFYRGESAPDDWLRVVDFFKTHPSLPADLEAEREFITLLSAPTEMEIPAHLDSRIEESLEQEFSISRHSHFGSFPKLFRKSHVGIAATLIALLAVGITIIKSDSNRDLEMTSPMVAAVAQENSDTSSLVAYAGDNSQFKKDTLLYEIHQLARYGEDARQSHVSARKETVTPNIVQPQNPSESTVVSNPQNETSRYDWVAEESERLMTEDERRMLDRNYYVVTDEREASAIISGVFSRLESNTAPNELSCGNLRRENMMEI